MKILFIRHGESEDDVIGAYGGWADFPLTEKGKDQILQTIEKIKALKIEFQGVKTSPLKRASESAKLIAYELNIPIRECIYVKERNTYGLLCGMSKDDAKVEYPDLVEAYNNDEYVLASEREEDISERVKIALEKIKEYGHENIIVVTHGNFLKAFMKTVLDKKLTKKEDGGMILIEFTETENTVLHQDGIEIE